MSKLNKEDKEFCIVYNRAGTSLKSVYHFTNKTTKFQAKKVLKRVKANYLKTYAEDVASWSIWMMKNKDVDIIESEAHLWELFKEHIGHHKGDQSGTFELMRWHEFEKFDKQQWCSDPVTLTNEKDYNNMLDVLPPHNWGHHLGVESFTMSEKLHSTFTSQYAKGTVDGETVYGCKTVDVFDKRTWISSESLTEAYNASKAA